MLIIISDLHLGDGTCGKSISASAFHLFADRLHELAMNASRRADARYEPIDEIDILLLGDILEALHSMRWLENADGQPCSIRPWTDWHVPEFAAKLDEITTAILEKNAESISVLRRLAGTDSLSLPPVNRSGEPDERSHRRHPVCVRIHYMIGNHDWFYHLPGAAFDHIRQKIITAFGLSNPSVRFPHDIVEPGAGWLKTLLDRYGVFARHGDIYDGFNFLKERDAAALGDVFAVEILNRFSYEARRQFKHKLPAALIESLGELVNVRPGLATSLWISSQLRQNNIGEPEQEQLKELWDRLCREFLTQPLVRRMDKQFKLDMLDWFKLGIKFTDSISFKTLDELVLWLRRKFWAEEELKFSSYALKEKAFKEEAARFIVYGHTHHHEVVPLDYIPSGSQPTSQMYMNSGTWHTYFDLAINKPEEQKFVPYQVLTYLAFFHDDERGGRRFETWSGSFSD